MHSPPRTKTPTTAAADVETQLQALERRTGDGDLAFDRGRKLHVSSLGKTYFPDTGVTKGALMRYYARICGALKPHVEDRPLVLKRYPDGIGGQMFFQQNAGGTFPTLCASKPSTPGTKARSRESSAVTC